MGLDSPLLSGVVLPALHLYPVTLWVHDGTEYLIGTICSVAKRFATPVYKLAPEIYFHVCPFKTASDESDDEFEDNDEIEPPCPTYRFDQFIAEQGRKQMMHERNQEVALWSTGVVAGHYQGLQT